MPHWVRAAVVIALGCSGLIAACDGRTSATADAAAADASPIAADRVSGDGANSADQASDADSAEADVSQTAPDRVSGDGANSADQASDADADSAVADASQTAADRVSGDGANSADQASDADADSAVADADADADSAACIILASNYDQPCTVDSDCTGAHMGDYCSVPTSPDPALLCPQSPISVAAGPRYAADVSRTPLGQAILARMFLGSSCGQVQPPVYCCRQGTCQGGASACM